MSSLFDKDVVVLGHHRHFECWYRNTPGLIRFNWKGIRLMAFTDALDKLVSYSIQSLQADRKCSFW